MRPLMQWQRKHSSAYHTLSSEEKEAIVIEYQASQKGLSVFRHLTQRARTQTVTQACRKINEIGRAHSITTLHKTCSANIVFPD